MSRKALIVGVDHYDHLPRLTGCVRDARSTAAVLERHADGSLNFPRPRVMLGTGEGGPVTRHYLKDAIRQLFDDTAEIALLYFAGHGGSDATGGRLIPSDAATIDDGVSLQEIMSLVNQSKATNKVVILDSCHSGAAGSNVLVPHLAEITEGVTILTATTAGQYALESGGSGLFTPLLVDALRGAAANLVGDVTPGSVYAHVDQSLGMWSQRPTFKTNVRRFVSLRTVEPSIRREDLRALTTLFPTADHQFTLDPTYEPERSLADLADDAVPDPDPDHTRIFSVLQRCVRVNLVRPVGSEHMWHAAMQSRSCSLTALGQHYWNLASEGLI